MTEVTRYTTGPFMRLPEPLPRSPRSSMAAVDAAAMSLEVAGRTRNQDRYFLRYPVFMVADGVGGRPAGGHAADRTVREAARAAAEIAHRRKVGRGGSDAETMRALSQIPARCQALLRADAALTPALSRMATTLTLVMVEWPIAHVVNVGDSPCYLLRDGELVQLTADHTVARALVAAGALAEEDVSQSPLRHMLSDAVSAGPTEVVPHAGRLQLRPRDVLILCTDGVSSTIPESRLTRIAGTAGSASEVCSWLTMALRAVDVSDDATAVVVRFLEPAERAWPC